jgi:DNA-directed RNA polymerase subunit RPC12/RpoP
MTEYCARCGGQFRIEEHHITPRAQGGTDEEENLIQLCAVCHDEIHTGVTHDKPAKFTGPHFEDWIEQYDGQPKETWEMEYVCNHCGYQWEGKPIQERTATKISCPRNNCMGSAHIILTEDIVIDAYSAKQILSESDSIDYVSLEIEIRKWNGFPWLQTKNERNIVNMYYVGDFLGGKTPYRKIMATKEKFSEVHKTIY